MDLDTSIHSGENQDLNHPANNHMVDPISLFSVVSYTAMALSNAYTGNRSRKLTRELEDERVKQKEVNDDKAHKRALEMQDYNFTNGLRSTEYSKNYDQIQIYTDRGNLLNTVAPNVKSPIVIFDTVIRNNTTKKDHVFAFNPMESLYYSFKNQTDGKLPEQLYVTNISKEFKSQSAAEAFYNDELPDKAAIIVYGSFDGNFLRINAVYGGMSIEQHTFDERLKPRIIYKYPYSLCLSEIPSSIISIATNSLDSESDLNIVQERIQKNLIDLIANTSLQALIDCHFSLYYPHYEPIVGLNNVLKETETLGLQTEEMRVAIENHRKNMLDQRNRVQNARIEFQKNFLKNNI